jgi:tRNA (guanosine-2'-O-)-methyltransferase
MFPFQASLTVDEDLRAPHTKILAEIFPLLTPERRRRIEAVVRGRCFSVVSVMENIYDRGNVSAVLRSAEALGFGQTHLIELGEKFKEANRVTAGADKWVEVKRWKSTRDCVNALKAEGKQIVVTHLDATSKPIAEIDFTRPTALVLGNEKDGISPEMAALADHRVVLPMSGFVQSYNISVAGALCFYHIYQDRLRRQGSHGDLSVEEQEILKAVYALRTLDSAADILRRLAQF